MLTLFLVAIAYLAIGSVAGILAGLLGIGGGIVTVPSLLLVFNLLGYPQAYLMHMAIGTSLAAMVFNTISSTCAHHKRQGVLWNIVRKMLPGLVIGSVLGAISAEYLSGIILEIFFGCFLMGIGILFLRKHKPHLEEHKLPRPAIFTLISTGIGWLSNLLGIGGGVITVPVLTSFKLQSKKAIGTSAATSLCISFIGALCYLWVGLGKLPFEETVGYINLPAFALIGIATFIAAPIGAKWTHQLPEHLLKRFLGGMLILVGAAMVFT
ncbi:MAG: sulfite exporter TauE/SafE family protein [Rhabdochlamydiaceae bacterium]|nr:sulfite exporter TauE/SafE family protein [Rhabdochlamydiaceae bacterium]